MKNFKILSVLALTAFLVGGNAYADELAGDSVNGASLFAQRCGVCHALDANHVGPKLRGVYGRKAGTVPDFHYSSAVQASAIVWDNKTLDQWLAGPQQFIPGQHMNFSLSDPQQRADIISYLKSKPGAK